MNIDTESLQTRRFRQAFRRSQILGRHGEEKKKKKRKKVNIDHVTVGRRSILTNSLGQTNEILFR